MTRDLRGEWDFNVEEYEAWVQEYQAIWWRICDILDIDSVAAIRNGYVNAKLITWDGRIRTGFQGTCPNPERHWLLQRDGYTEDRQRLSTEIELSFTGLFERVVGTRRET